MLDGMKGTGRGAVVVSLAGVLAVGPAGCAGRVSPPYSETEQARVDEYESAAERILESREIGGRPPIVQVASDPALVNAGHPAAYYRPRAGLADLGRPGTIVINRSVL